jgi:hypothetical protein
MKNRHRLCAVWLALLGIMMSGPAVAAKNKYKAGQIWSYKSRPQDAGSLIKIQRIESFGPAKKSVLIYHISMIGVALGGGPATEISHLPVSRETLDKSVDKLVVTSPVFPTLSTVDGGIEQWRKNKGGVFAVSLAEIADVVDQSIQ